MQEALLPRSTDADLSERVRWMLRLRWLVVPVFVALELASDLLLNRRPVWTAPAVGSVLLAANAVWVALLSVASRSRTLVAWGRFDSALVTAVPAALVILYGEPAHPLRYGVLMGVLGAAAVLPKATDVAVVAGWAMAALVLADAVVIGFDSSRVDQAMGARWATEAVVILAVAAFAGYLHFVRERAGDRVRALEGDLARAKGGLVQADKLAAVGVLASGVAHEINNPTAFVTSNLFELKRYLASYESAVVELSRLALEGGQVDRARSVLARDDLALSRQEAPGAIDDSLAGMERVQRIATNLRTIARRDEPGELAPIDLGEIVQAVARTAASSVRGATARIDAPGGPVWVRGKRGELVDAVLNLAVNAIQAGDEGRPNAIAVELRTENGTAILRVSDSGRGMGAAQMKRLFEPSTNGDGLGLSLVREIVAAHRGEIDVASEVGKGSTFTVRLPVCEEAHERGAAPSPALTPLPTTPEPLPRCAGAGIEAGWPGRRGHRPS